MDNIENVIDVYKRQLINMRIQYDNKANQGDKKLALPYYSDVKNINTNKKSDDKNVTTVDNGIKLEMYIRDSVYLITIIMI